jgi:hypothetical protein
MISVTILIRSFEDKVDVSGKLEFTALQIKTSMEVYACKFYSLFLGLPPNKQLYDGAYSHSL